MKIVVPTDPFGDNFCYTTRMSGQRGETLVEIIKAVEGGFEVRTTTGKRLVRRADQLKLRYT